MDVLEVIRRWPTQDAAMAHLEAVRWGGKPVCPYCAGKRVGVHASKDKRAPRLQCYECRRAFNATVGTIFHNTHLNLQTWFIALFLIREQKSAISCADLSRILNIPYKTAWNISKKIREVFENDPSQVYMFDRILANGSA